jgi:hypothetical protein
LTQKGLAQLFLGACTEPDVERIIFLDVPAVLGWEAWRDLAGRYGLGLIQLALQSALDAGAIVAQPVASLVHVLVAPSTSSRSTPREPRIGRQRGSGARDL